MPYIHHTVLHFALGLAFLPPIFGAARWFRGDARWPAELRWIVYVMVAASVITAGSGLLSAEHVIQGGLDAKKVHLHRNVALAAAGLWVLLGAATLWVAKRDEPGPYKALTAATAVGTALISVAGHFGGDMLHPGLAPWSTAGHSHGPAGSHHDEPMPEMSAMPGMSTMPSSVPSDGHGHAHEHEHAH